MHSYNKSVRDIIKLSLEVMFIRFYNEKWVISIHVLDIYLICLY